MQGNGNDIGTTRITAGSPDKDRVIERWFREHLAGRACLRTR